jgi:hypothetical protein
LVAVVVDEGVALIGERCAVETFPLDPHSLAPQTPVWPDGRDGSEELVEVLGTDADEALAEA